ESTPEPLLISEENGFSESTGFYYPNGAQVATIDYGRRSGEIRMAMVRADAEERLVASGEELVLGSDPAGFIAAGGYLYRLAMPFGQQTNVERWSIKDLRAGRDTPSLHLTFELPADFFTASFDVDPRARTAAVLLSRGLVADSAPSLLYFVDFGGAAPVVEASEVAPARRVRVRGDEVAVVAGPTVTFRDRNGRETIFEQHSKYIIDVLAFDRNSAYVRTDGHWLLVIDRRHPELKTLQAIELPGEATKLVEARSALVLATESGIATLSPACE
ncbi:MAG TPA: hypothetical protein VIV60_06795, partial [Polyangiaceae bacterium]